MKNALLILATAALTSCGTASSVRVNVPAADRVAFQFSDERPPEERISRIEESAFGVTSFYGDETLSPSASELFKSYLAANLNEALSGKSVKLTAFSVSALDPKTSLDGKNFNTAASSVPNANPLGVMLAAPLILGIESIKSQKQVAVQIRAVVSDQEFSSQCSDNFRGRATEENIRSVVLACLEQICGDIRVTHTR